MKDGVTIEMTGLSEFVSALSALTDKELFAVLRSGMRKGLQMHIIKPVRAAIPYASLKKSVGIVNDRSNKNELSMWGGIVIGKRPDAATPPDGVKLRWLEHGTAVRQTKAGWNRGAIAPQARIVPVVISGTPKVAHYLNTDFGDQIVKFLDRKIKKYK
jgi:hypothetical protein